MKMTGKEFISGCKAGWDKTECVVTKAVNGAKNIIVHPKLNADLEINSKKTGKELFKCKVNVDKELSLLKIIGIVAGVIAFTALVSALMDKAVEALFCKKKDDYCNDEF